MISSQKPGISLEVPLFARHQTNYQPNVFTESRQEFTELEKKIVILVINQLGHLSLKGKIVPGANMVFQIPYAELTAKRYDQVANAAETLQRKQLKYRNDQMQKFDFITPFPRVRSQVVDGKKVVELTMFADVVPHFAELGQRYTKYDIDVMLSLSSVYAQRMFEIVSMFINRGQSKFSYTVIELRDMLNCPESYRYIDVKVNALDLAKRELQRKANINLEFVPSAKEGKKVMALLFTIKTSHQLATEAVHKDRQTIYQMPVHEAVVSAWHLMKNYKLKGWQKDLIISDHSLLEVFYRVDSELANGLRANIKNPTAYLIKSLGIDQTRSPRKTKPAPAQQLGVSGTMSSVRPTRTQGPQSIASIFGTMITDE